MTFKKIVENIYPVNKYHEENPPFSRDRRRNFSSSKKKVIDYFDTVQKRATTTNEKFIRKNLPYRIRAYTIGKRAFIGLTIYDNKNVQINTITREITNDDFSVLMDNLTSGSGLIFDNMPGWELK
jgi:hypothetical protein